MNVKRGLRNIIPRLLLFFLFFCFVLFRGGGGGGSIMSGVGELYILCVCGYLQITELGSDTV